MGVWTWWHWLIVVGLLGGLMLWPLTEAATRGRWGWFVLVLCLGPIGGLAWFSNGRYVPRAQR